MYYRKNKLKMNSIFDYIKKLHFYNEITGLKFRIENIINEKTSMNIEMQHLRDRERNLMDELLFKE